MENPLLESLKAGTRILYLKDEDEVNDFRVMLMQSEEENAELGMDDTFDDNERITSGYIRYDRLHKDFFITKR